MTDRSFSSPGRCTSHEDGKIIINEMHDRKRPLLKATPTLVGSELRIDEPFLNTAHGRDTALLVKEGVYQAALSVEMYVETVHTGQRRHARNPVGVLPEGSDR